MLRFVGLDDVSCECGLDGVYAPAAPDRLVAGQDIFGQDGVVCVYSAAISGALVSKQNIVLDRNTGVADGVGIYSSSTITPAVGYVVVYGVSGDEGILVGIGDYPAAVAGCGFG